MRPRAPIAFAGLLIVALSMLIGFAAFSTPTTQPTLDVALGVAFPTDARGRVAAGVFAAALAPDTTAAPEATAAPDRAPTPARLETAAEAPASTTTSTTAAPTTAAAPTTTTATPTTTTAAPTTTTTTTTAAPATTTTTTSTTTTTAAPIGGGPGDVAGWRPLVSAYFPAAHVDDALSVMDCESHGDPAAYNSASGASGLYQFVPNTWNWASSNAGLAGASPFNGEANIASAAWLVQHSIDTGHPEGPWGHWVCQP